MISKKKFKKKIQKKVGKKNVQKRSEIFSNASPRNSKTFSEDFGPKASTSQKRPNPQKSFLPLVNHNEPILISLVIVKRHDRREFLQVLLPHP